MGLDKVVAGNSGVGPSGGAAPASALSPQAQAIVDSAGFPPELGPPAALFVRRDIAPKGAALTSFIETQSGDFSADGSLGRAVRAAARAMNPAASRSSVVFDLGRLADQPPLVRARAWMALNRMTEQLAPPAERPTPNGPDGKPVRVPDNARPELAAPRGAAGPTGAREAWADHQQLRGTSVDFREWFANAGNRRLVFQMLLERQPSSVAQGLDLIAVRYPGASNNLQQVTAALQYSLEAFGYQGNGEGIPNARMASALEFAREQVRPHLTDTVMRADAAKRAGELNLSGHPDLLAAIDLARFGWRSPA